MGVKKFLAISFLFIYLFSTTELHQFLKIPVLFEHFSEHRSKDKSLSFLNFLYLHYKNNTKDSDYNRDLKLPFKTIDNCSTSIHIGLSTDLKLEIKEPICFFEKKEISNFYKSRLHPNYLNAIWQPPKIC